MSFSVFNDLQLSFAKVIFGELDTLVSCYSSPLSAASCSFLQAECSLFISAFNPKDLNSIFSLCMNFQSNAFKEPITDV